VQLLNECPDAHRDTMKPPNESIVYSEPVKTVTQTSAGGVVVDYEGRIVLTARRSFKGELQWGLPKGLVEKGETPESAAAREATEETGLVVEVISPLEKIDYWYLQPPRGTETEKSRVHKFVHFFLMRAVGGDPQNHDAETEEVAFFAPPEAVKRASFSGEKKILKKAAALLSSTSQP
jgi:8-oxo-dGTP pyrophosphatase MutT (NUDIX family)